MLRYQLIKSIVPSLEDRASEIHETMVFGQKLQREPRRFFMGIHLYRQPKWLASSFGLKEKIVPFSVTWEYWEQKIKKICPIQYWIRETLRRELHFWFVMYPRRRWYEFKCWLSPYNRLKIHTLPCTWTDESHLLVHAMFAVLERYMNQKPDSIVDFTEQTDHKKFWKEINEVWTWWQDRDKRQKAVDEAYEISSKRPNHYKYKAKYREVNSLEKRHAKEEKQMLLKLIEWKDYLWV